MVQEVKKSIDLKVYYTKGVDGNGKPVVKFQRFKNIKVDATSTSIKAIGDKIASLLNYPVLKIETEIDSVLEVVE